MNMYLTCEVAALTLFMNYFLCNLKGRVVISFGMLLMCSGNDCPTARSFSLSIIAEAWKPAIPTQHNKGCSQKNNSSKKPK